LPQAFGSELAGYVYEFHGLGLLSVQINKAMQTRAITEYEIKE